jgi:hypothetical protein
MSDEPQFIGAELEFTFTIVPHWLLQVLKPIELTTYVALGQYADKDIQRSRYSTIKALQGLEDKGVVEIKERYKDKGEQTSNLYILKLTPGVSRKLDRGGKENVTGRGIENLTQTILNRTISNELYSREVQELYVNAMQQVCSLDKPTKSQWGRIYKAAKEMHEAGYEPGDIPVIAENLLKTYGAGALTPQGIVNNVQLLKGARTASAKQVENAIDQKKMDDWANETN